MGVIIAVLRGEGTEPEVREEYIISVIKGAREGRQTFTKVEGSGSSLQVDDFDFWMMDIISLMAGNLKEESDDRGQSTEKQGDDNCL